MNKTNWFNKKIKLTLLVIAAVSAISFVNFDDKNFEIAKNLDIYHTLFREINMLYVDEVDPGELVKTSIDNMLESLDPYTVFIPESDMEDYKFMTTGKYGGIGALIRRSNEYVIIAEPYEGFPAHKAGLKAGDKIVKVNGKSAKSKNTEQISELLKGEPGTEIKLSIERLGKPELLEVTVIREKIKINSVPYYGMLNETIGYIRLSSFTEACSQEVKDAFKELQNNHGMKSLVFDLRGNPGGLLNEAVAISNLFVPKDQVIVNTKGKIQQWNMSYNAMNDPLDLNIPLVILTNSGSASASEIVSGVMQDLDRGVIVGTRTFGKGLVQTTRDLSYNTKLKLTTAKYYTPSGRCIQALDYSNRNEDGSVGRVPDSLISEFKTKAGRSVYDGGGIEPDIKVESPVLSNIAVSLYTKNLIFDFATEFQFRYDSIEPADKFKITDNMYNEFIEFLADKEYDYTMKCQNVLDNLEKTIKEEKYANRLNGEIDELRKLLAHDKQKDLQTFKDEISSLLVEEITSRYYFQTGRAQSMLNDDPAITEGIRILNNMDEYKNILTAQAK